MRYGYARVSTRGQIKGNSLTEQRQQLINIVCDEVIEEQYTGATTERANLIKVLTYKGIRVNILNMGEVNERPQGRLMIHILLAFAEFERDMIVERTKAGFREGRSPIDKARKDAAIDMVINGGKSYKEAANAVGISKSTLVMAIRIKKCLENNTCEN